MSNKNQVFLNPYTQSPLIWHAQGAYISWGYSQSQAKSGLSNKGQSNGFAALSGIQVTYARSVSTQYPIGGSAPLQIIGSPSGGLKLTTLLGPQESLSKFIKAAGDACKPIYICIQPFALSQQNCDKSAGKTIITLVGCVSTGLGLTIGNAGGGGQSITMVTVPITMQFTDMIWSN